MKKCFKCGVTKALDAFYRHARMADGHLNKCIECTKADALRHRQGNLERVRAYDRKRNAQRSPEDKERFREIYHERYPQRRRALRAVQKALQKGILTREPCIVCGEKAHAHHPAYDLPLAVVWLCPVHHKATHAVARQA